MNGTWDNFDSLKSRIMVAAGGGGSAGTAGGLFGYDGGGGYDGKGGRQTGGGTAVSNHYYCGKGGQTAGSFGKGGNGGMNSDRSGEGLTGGGSGGGGGYYGGSGGAGICTGVTNGGGGSSYISGHEGCIAIDSTSTVNNIIPAENSLHYSGYFFTETVIIDGLGYRWTTEKEQEATGMPTHDGSETMMGNPEDGYAKITYLNDKL